LPVNVRIHDLPAGRWRADFDLERGALPRVGPASRWIGVTGEARLIGGRLVITKLCLDVGPVGVGEPDANGWVDSVEPDVGLDSYAVRLPMGRLLDSIRHEVIAQRESHLTAHAFGFRPDAETRGKRRRAAKALKGKVVRRGRPPGPHYGEEHYRHVAEVALQLQQDGAGSIRAAVADWFDISDGTARDWTKRARRLGWLAPTTPGARGLDPGDRLRHAWKDERK
jgi:hypothetical protein